MIDGKNVRNIVILVMLILPVLSTAFQDILVEHTVWIVMADSQDENVDIALKTLHEEVSSIHIRIKKQRLDQLSSVPLHADMIVIIGHGTRNGLQTSRKFLSWSTIYDAVAKREPQKTVVLACHSPSDSSSNIFGFDGRVDAEAGAIMIGWYVKQMTNPHDEVIFPLDRIAQAQSAMLHPLERYLYFVHGYWGENRGFYHMRDYLRANDIDITDYNEIRFFSYFDYYGATDEGSRNIVHFTHTISDFANNFASELLNLPSGSQVNIVAHSMGGIITREMLALHRTEIDNANINIGKVIMLGTPNRGTNLADPDNDWAYIMSLIGGYMFTGYRWPSPVFWSMEPLSFLIITLNWDPMSYSSGIDWYTVSGFDFWGSAATLFIHGDLSDPIVAKGRAHLSFATTAHFDVAHDVLIEDTENQATYATVFGWAIEGTDSDGDGLTNDAEIYYHETDPNDWDSDNDGLSDYDEVAIYATDPNDSNTDNDWIQDGDEVEWGYDPLDSTNPVPYSSLISSVSIIDSTVKAYVTHYSAIDYVKFYAKYRTKFGSWTGYYYYGIDYSPSSGKYYKSWTHPSGYAKMMVMVKTYDSSGHLLGIDTETYSIGGGGGGGDPPID
jgi:pimeloyl-ACP methyl ester carboxylesterase